MNLALCIERDFDPSIAECNGDELLRKIFQQCNSNSYLLDKDTRFSCVKACNHAQRVHNNKHDVHDICDEIVDGACDKIVQNKEHLMRPESNATDDESLTTAGKVCACHVAKTDMTWVRPFYETAFSVKTDTNFQTYKKLTPPNCIVPECLNPKESYRTIDEENQSKLCPELTLCIQDIIGTNEGDNNEILYGDIIQQCDGGASNRDTSEDTSDGDDNDDNNTKNSWLSSKYLVVAVVILLVCVVVASIILKS